MELYQLTSFVTVARLGNMTRAAETLYISLPALSTQIKQLEDELQIKLFARKPRGMELTPEGKILLDYAARAVDSADEVRRQALRMQGDVRGNLVIGLNTDPGFLRISRLNGEIARVIPNAVVHYEVSQSTKTAEMLANGDIDVGFVYGTVNHPDVTSIPITTALVQVVIPKTLLPTMKGITWEDLGKLPWIWGSCDCPFHVEMARRIEKYMPPKKILMASDEYVMRELVKAGQGACILRSDYIEELVQNGTVHLWKKDSFTVPLSITYLTSRKNEPIINAALTIIRGVFLDIQEQAAI